MQDNIRLHIRRAAFHQSNVPIGWVGQTIWMIENCSKSPANSNLSKLSKTGAQAHTAPSKVNQTNLSIDYQNSAGFFDDTEKVISGFVVQDPKRSSADSRRACRGESWLSRSIFAFRAMLSTGGPIIGIFVWVRAGMGRSKDGLMNKFPHECKNLSRFRTVFLKCRAKSLISKNLRFGSAHSERVHPW